MCSYYIVVCDNSRTSWTSQFAMKLNTTIQNVLLEHFTCMVWTSASPIGSVLHCILYRLNEGYVSVNTHFSVL